MNIPVAVQLYTLREETQKDFVGTLEKVAEIGYQGVEFAGYGGLKASELRKHLEKFGLKAAGSHVPIDDLTSQLDEVIAFNAEIGSSYIVCPGRTFDNVSEYKEAAKQFNDIGMKCKENGITFCYHNHAHEFKLFDGKYGLDILYQNTDSALVQAEIDTYWVQYAGINPVEYVQKYSGRCPLIHLKDMEDEQSKDFAEVGNGIMDIGAIITAGTGCGAKWFIVEQDRCKRPALESIKLSFENLKKII